MAAPTAFFIDIDWARAGRAYERAGIIDDSDDDPDKDADVGRALARAIASSPGWKHYPPGAVVFRPGSPPTLGILFERTVSDTRSLEVRAAHLPLALDLMRFRSWSQVVEDVTVLAGRLRDELSPEELRTSRWMGVPRGGRIVLGLLSYLLDLPPGSTGEVEDGPIVIVDDCVLSGRRLGEQLSSLETDLDARGKSNRNVFVATLFSHPAVRERVSRREPRVKGILSARDLEDHAEEVYGQDTEAWKERWARRSDSEGLWVGLPDHICFPWNEPDTGLWNGDEEIPAWRILPAEICLKNHPRRGDSLETRIMTDEGGYLVPRPDVLAGPVGEGFVLASRGTGRSLRLSGSALDMWSVSTRQPDPASAAGELASRFAVDEAVVRGDLQEFEEGLIDSGFAERRP